METTEKIPILSFKPPHIPLIFALPPQKWTTMRNKEQKPGPYRVQFGRYLYGTVAILPDEDYPQPFKYSLVEDKEKLARSEGYTSLQAFEHMLYNFNSHGHFCYREFLSGSKKLFIYRIYKPVRTPDVH